MKFSLEFANGGDEYKEEQERLKKGDPAGENMGKRFYSQSFTPLEEIPDPDTLENDENDLDTEDFKKEEENEPLTEEEEEEKMLGDFVRMAEDVGFKQGKGAAHVGPEFNEEKFPIKDVKKKEPILANEDEKLLKIKHENNRPSIEKGYKRPDPHDNFKTLKKIDPKVARVKRGETREVLHADVEEEPVWQDPLDSLDLSEN